MFNFLIILFVFIVDFSSKSLVTHFMSYGERIKLTPFFNFVYTKNLGVSFSLFYNNHRLGPWILGGISAVIVTFIYKFLSKTSHSISRFSLLCVIGGALGNLFDRFYYGGVIDFLDFHAFSYHWPAFNLADMFIVIGLFTYWWIERK